MLRHYVGVVMPEGFKAQVVATSRRCGDILREASGCAGRVGRSIAGTAAGGFGTFRG